MDTLYLEKSKTLTSLEVAEMVGKTHSDLLKDIRRFTEYLAEGDFPLGERKIALGEFFLEDSYLDINSQQRPCYQITKKGCELIAHKMTGKKGTQFTATYIEKFHQMEDELLSPPTVNDLILNPDLIIQLATELKHKSLLISVKDQQIAELQPRANYTDLILQNKELIPITLISKDYGMSARKMNVILHELGVQYKTGDTWVLYRDYQSEGYTHTKTYKYKSKSTGLDKVTVNTEWTQKGRLFLYGLLKINKYLPVIEQNSDDKILELTSLKRH